MHQVPPVQPQLHREERHGSGSSAAVDTGTGPAARAMIIDFYLPGASLRQSVVEPNRCCQHDHAPAGDEWDTRVGSAAVAGTTAIGPPRPGTENAFFVRHSDRITYLRAALSSPVTHRSPAPPTAVYAHTRMNVVPGCSTPSAPIFRRVYVIIFGFFLLSFSRITRASRHERR